MFRKILKYEYFNIVAASVCVTLMIIVTGVGIHYYYSGENEPTSTTEKISKPTTEEILKSTTLTTSEPELKTKINKYLQQNNDSFVATSTTEEISKSTTLTTSKPELKTKINKYLQQNNYTSPACDYGYSLDSKGRCVENNECDCLKEAYSDNATCVAKKTTNFLLVVKDISAERVEPSDDIDWLDYPRTHISAENDCNNEEIYLIKRNDKSEIKKMSYNGGNAQTFITIRGKPEGLSLDWISNKIYWIDSEKKRISFVNLNDTESIVHLIDDEEINNPRDIVVHPGEKKIFWTDWWEEDGGRIMWANENGSDVGIFYKSLHVQYPNTLAINWEKNNLCWSDVKTLKINCVDIFNTTNVQTLVTNISDPFDLGIIGNRFYFTNRLEQKIWQFNGEERQVLMSTPEDGNEYLYGFVPVPRKCPELKSKRTNVE